MENLNNLNNDDDSLKDKFNSKFNNICYIGLGSNIGNGIQNINDAIVCISVQTNIIVIGKSNFYKSAPVNTDGNDYINAVIKILTSYNPFEIFTILQFIEKQFGRKRPYKYAPRILDLDVLLYNNENINSDLLTIPHAQITKRAFVLMPLIDIDEHISIPNKGLAKNYLINVAHQRISRIKTHTNNICCSATNSNIKCQNPKK